MRNSGLAMRDAGTGGIATPPMVGAKMGRWAVAGDVASAMAVCAVLYGPEI